MLCAIAVIPSASSTSFTVQSVDHSSWFTDGKYFNFHNDEVDAILGRTDWNDEVFTVNVERGDEFFTTDVKMWREANGGSIGDGHGRREPESSASIFDWREGDRVEFVNAGKWIECTYH